MRLGFGVEVTEGQVRRLYTGTPFERNASEIVLVLRLALALVLYGHTLSDAEQIVQDMCRYLSLPGCQITLNLGQCYFSVGGLPPHFVRISRGIVADKLTATTKLATFVSSTREPIDADACLFLLDRISTSPEAHGKLVHALGFQVLVMLAAICAFGASYIDAVAAGIFAPVVMLMMRFCGRVKLLLRLESLLIPMVLGLIIPLVWKYLIKKEPCHVTSWYLSALIIQLPGSQLIYGTYEIMAGAMTDGAARMVGALVRCMFLALGLVLGWQALGHNAATPYIGQSGIMASLPPQSKCDSSDVPWWLTYGVYSLPLLICFLINLNCRFRDMPGPLGIAYLTLLGYMSLRKWDLMPPLMVNIITVFFAGCLSSILELLTETPKQVPLLPVVLFLAPGSTAMRACIQGIHRVVYDVPEPILDVWTGFMLEAASFAAGLYLAQAAWRPIMRRRHRQLESDRSPFLEMNAVEAETQFSPWV